uniref:Col_cuticle_N domain-containing protein n=1 Tax=Caenorhabditis tropicalis TaxID=1561998 RepID=A0A1I7UXX0_9PELO
MTQNHFFNRGLAFGTAATEEHKPLDDFYNNSTLTNISKLFCAIVLLTAFFLVMSRSLQFAYEAQQAAARSAALSSNNSTNNLSNLLDSQLN